MTSSDVEVRVAALFDDLAPGYDATGVDFFQPIADGLLRAVEPQHGEAWLDLGCGAGAVLLPLAQLVSPGRATGVDISPAMVERTRRAVDMLALANVDVLVGSAQRPELPLASFDGISSSLVLFFLADPLGALQAWRPLLRSHGRIGVTTFGRTDPRWREVEAVLRPFLPANDARSSGVAGPFESDDAMEALLASAGFSDVRTITQEVTVDFTGPEQWREFSMSVGQRQAWMSIPDADREAVFDEAAARFRQHAEPDGSARFTQEVRHTVANR